MDSLGSMNKALAYIEEHLTEDIDYSEVSKIAGEGYTQSGFHLQDMRQPLVLKFCGTRVQTLEIQSIEAKSGFQ